jgi:hypothetical protein
MSAPLEALSRARPGPVGWVYEKASGVLFRHSRAHEPPDPPLPDLE